jgi:phage gp36-like protein
MSRELTIAFQGAGATLYAVVRRVSDGAAADLAAEAFEAWDNASLGDYDLALTDRGGDHYTADFPSWVTAGTEVEILYYEQAGASPATTDDLIDSERRTWTGSALAAAASSYTGRYTDTATLRRRFGTCNINKWSNSEGGDSADDNAIEDAIRWAEDDIDARFAGSPYTIPFAASGAALPRTLKDWANVLAGWYLYTKRGLEEDKSKTGGKLQALKDAAEAEMRRFASGYPKQLTGVTLRSDASVAVTVVDPEVEISTGANLIPTWQNRYGP